MNEELKPCPFCSSTKLAVRKKRHAAGGAVTVTYFILCLDCEISAGEYYSRAEIVEAWNQRPAETQETTP